MSKDYKRDWLKERRQHTYWKEKYKELEATIKGTQQQNIEMAEAKEEYDQAMSGLHEAHDKLVAELEQCKEELKECREECQRKDEELAKLREDLGNLLKPGPLERQVADESVEADEDGSESKDGDTSDGTSSGTSDEEGEEEEVDKDADLLKKLRF